MPKKTKSAPVDHGPVTSLAQARAWAGARGVTEIECLVPDLAGVARGKIMPSAKFFDDPTMALPSSIFMQTISGEYPEETADFRYDPSDGDIELRPDFSTLCEVPWARDPTAQVIHDAVFHDGRAVEIAPRQVLKRVIDLYREQGWEPIVAPELEFYLVKRNIDPDYPLEPPIGRSGRAEAGRRSYSISAVNEFDAVFEDIYAFTDAQGKPTPAFFHFSAGHQRWVPAVTCMLAPYVNSYRRLVKGASAPVNVQWGYDNRTTGLRIPPSSPVNRRVENRVPSSDANPYLAMAASLACGYLGLTHRLTPGEPASGDGSGDEFDLPVGLLEAVGLFEETAELSEVFGRGFVTTFAAVKRAEFATFMRVISPWEREFLLLNV